MLAKKYMSDMHRVMYSGSASTQSMSPAVSSSTLCFHSSCDKVMFTLFRCFCTCSESVRFSPLCAMRLVLQGHHTACIMTSDNTKTLTCSVCLDSVRRTISTEFDSTLSPAVRFVSCAVYIAVSYTHLTLPTIYSV